MLTARIETYCHQGGSGPFLRDVSLDLREGEVFCLLGPSSVGKTTILGILLGATRGISRASIQYHSTGLVLSPLVARRAGLVGVSPTGAPMVPWLSMHENLLLPHLLNPKIRAPKDETLRGLLNRLALAENHLSLRPHEVSEGTRHRFALARALLFDQPFLFLDEVFTGLDEPTADLIAKALRDHVTGTRATCLLISHDLFRAREVSDVLAVLMGNRTLSIMPPGATDEQLHRKLNEALQQLVQEEIGAHTGGSQ